MFNYRLFSLLESILYVDDRFYEIINSLASSDDVIAGILLKLVDKDIKTNFNYLKPSDLNNQIGFVNDTQVQRIVDRGENPFNKATNKTNVGRAVQQILKDNGYSPTPSDIEKFTNNYKLIYDIIVLGKTSDSNIKEVSGEDIRYWYSEDRYVSGGGTLNNSCMRYSQCQKFLSIYVENPEVCRLVLLLSDDKQKLMGRALLWTLEDGTFYLDRIYTRYDYQVKIIYNYFKNKYPNNFSHNDDDHGMIVKLKKSNFEYYPYMDSLRYLEINSNTLSDDGFDDIYFELRETGGDKEVKNGYWSERLNMYISRKDAVNIGSYYDADWVTKDVCVWSNEEDKYIFKEFAVETEWGIFTKDKCVEIERNGKMVWVPEYKIIKIYKDGSIIDTIEGEYDTDGLVSALFKNEDLEVYAFAKESDIIEVMSTGLVILNDHYKKLISKFGDVVKSYNQILEVNIIDECIDDILAEDKFIPIVGNSRASKSYIALDISNLYNLKYEKTKYKFYINLDAFYGNLFENENSKYRKNILITDFIDNNSFTDELNNKLVKLHSYYLTNSRAYSMKSKTKNFKIEDFFKEIYPNLKNSSINDSINDFFTIIPGSPNFKQSQNNYAVNEYNDRFYTNKSADEINKILPTFFDYWKKIVVYMFITSRREPIIESFSIGNNAHRFLLMLTYDEFEMGEKLYRRSGSFFRENRDELEILREIEIEDVIQLIDMYLEKEGF